MPKPPKNIAASVRARLMNHAQAKGAPFDLVLNRFVIERLLYRLGAPRRTPTRSSSRAQRSS